MIRACLLRLSSVTVLNAAENLITNPRDSGIDLGFGCIDMQVHHNTIIRKLG